MPFPYDRYPWLNFQELNLAYFIKHFQEIFQQWDQLYHNLLDWKDATDTELAEWKTAVETGISSWETGLTSALEVWKSETESGLATWKTQMESDISTWEVATLAALEAWKTATTAVFEQIRTEAAASATAAAGSASAAETAKTAAQTAQAAAEAAAAGIQSELAQIQTNSANIADLQAEVEAVDTALNEAASLVNYHYDTPYDRAENPSSSSTLVFGIKRDNRIIILNNSTAINDYARIRLSEDVVSLLGNNGTSTIRGWNTGFTLTPGHRYRATLKLLSGSITLSESGMMQATLVVCRTGESSNIASIINRDDVSFVSEFTADTSVYNLLLYITANTYTTSAKFLATLEDLDDVPVYVDDIDNVLAYGMKKHWAPEDLVNGYWQSRAIVPVDTAVCSRNLYDVKAGDIIKIANNTNGLNFAYSVYLDPSGSADASGWLSDIEHEHTISTTGRLFIQFKNSDNSPISPSDITILSGIMDDGYIVTNLYRLSAEEERTKQEVEKLLSPDSKTIAFLGDSITAGVGTNMIYHMYLGDRFGWVCKNYGYGGSGYARSYPGTGGKMATGQVGMGATITASNKFEPNDFLTRIATIDTNIDALVIFGGTNDWAHGDTISVSAFETAVENVLSYAQTNFGRIPIILLTPIHRGDDTVPNPSTGKTLEDYRGILKNVSMKHGIKTVDLFAESGLYPDNTHNSDIYYTRDDTAVSDKLHPNHYAHLILANLLAPVLYNALM